MLGCANRKPRGFFPGSDHAKTADVYMQTIHLIVEAGPDKGRSLQIPPDGARAGRASGNDIVLNDASLSRFHCRFYFKDGGELFVSDLASTNETLVNDHAIQDVRLNVGDRVAIGETVMKVVGASLGGVTARAPEAAAAVETAPTVTATEPAAPLAAAAAVPADEIDLGLHPRAALPIRRAAHGRRSPSLIVVLILAVAVIGIALAVKYAPRAAAGVRPITADPDDAALDIDYEKVEASTANIFRYRFQLRDGTLSIRIDNLEDGRHLSRDKKLPPETVRELAQRLRSIDFFPLNPEYAGLTPEVWESRDLSLTLGRRTHRVRVVNRIEPPAFRDVRITIEEFGKSELSFFAVALPRERLLELAQEAWLQGRKLFDEREVLVSNLARAIRNFAEVETMLEPVEPKPELYARAVAAREECEVLLQQRFDDLDFQADRAIRSSEWKVANDHLGTILVLLQDREDDRYQRSYKKLLYVQSKLRIR
jgi:hypothetical protein